MPDLTEYPYQSAPLTQFSWKERLSIRLADVTFYLAIKLIGSTLKYEPVDREKLDAIDAAGRIPIYTFWHDRIFAGTYFFRDRGIVVLTSQSKDGEYIARFIRRLGYGAIRGSSTRGGSKALVQMIKAMRSGLPMAFTADGPKGPRYIAKPGAVLLAKKTGNPIFPFVVEPQSYWTVKSWDRMQIPKPFSKVAVIMGDAIYVPVEASEEVIGAKLKELQSTLDHLVARGESWRRTG